jgi:type IV secretory pathway VirD2 relaxase
MTSTDPTICTADDYRHQFRFIVSAEESVELTDLRQTTRDLMTQMESDLGTKLDWIAVDHHNTGHPHTHILMRGVTDDGKMLNIARDYIAHGIRERASEIVKLELGRQTEQEVSRQLEREVDAERFTRLDRMLIAAQERDKFSDLRPDKDMAETMRQNRALLIDRARKLERMGLAAELRPGLWTVYPRAEGVLRELGERGDIIKTMHRALDGAGLADRRSQSRYVMHPAPLAEPVIGRVLSKGLGMDEMGERVRLIVDGVDGRIHHLEVDAARAEDVGRGIIVQATPPPKPRAPPTATSSRRPMRMAFTVRQRTVNGRWRVSAATMPMPMSAAMSAAWRHCGAPGSWSASMPSTGPSPPICPSAVLPMTSPARARTRGSQRCRRSVSNSRSATTARPGSTARSWRTRARRWRATGSGPRSRGPSSGANTLWSRWATSPTLAMRSAFPKT